MALPSEVVITTWFTSAPDPNRGDVCRTGGSEVMAELRESVHRHGRHLVVLHDCLDDADDELTTFIDCGVVMAGDANPYFRRWEEVLAFLRGHDHIRRVWMVDAPDVVMLNDPFPHMDFNVLYVGSEECTLAAGTMEGDWMRANHPNWAPWLDSNAECRLLNPGIIGGAAIALMYQCGGVLSERRGNDKTDMAAFNYAMRKSLFRWRTGPVVHSPFRSMARSGAHWWAHK